MFSFEVGYEILIEYDENELWSAYGFGDFVNLFFTSGLANITTITYGTMYQKEDDKIVARNNLNSTFIKHCFGFGLGGYKLNFNLGLVFLYNLKEAELNEYLFGAEFSLHYYLKGKK